MAPDFLLVSSEMPSAVLPANKLTPFAGNLPSERVTKRDLFHVFHKYGKLAQISIKQAYGFIQFLDAESCHRALQAEQGGLVRGRKIRKHTPC
jgi:RNA recognition motif-containing protein